MRVILQQDVKNLGKKGQTVEVAEGYGRNFLIPRGLAILATEANVRKQKHVQAAEQEKADRERARASELAEELSKAKVTISAKTGESGRLFGSVTAGDIADAVAAQTGHQIDKRKIDLKEPLRELGVYDVEVRLHPGIHATLKVEVAAE